MTFDEQQAERAAKGETVFAGTWLPSGEGLYLLSATTIDDLKIRINELEQWIAAIADDHQQIPDWIQQSARSLLAQE